MQYMEPISSILVYAKQDEKFIKSVEYQVVWTKKRNNFARGSREQTPIASQSRAAWM